MALPKGHVNNFNQLLRAARNGDLALLECTDAKTGEMVPAIVMVNTTRGPNGKEFEMVPVARLFDGNPYEQLVPPDPEAVVPH